MKQLRVLLIVLLVFGLLNAGLLSWYVWGVYQFRNPETTTLLIETGTSVKRIASALQEKGVIADARVFEYALRLTGRAGAIQAGEYEFGQGLALAEVMEVLLGGEVKFYTFTIPEGYNLQQITKVLVGDKKIMTQGQFEELIRRVDLLEGVAEAQDLEGFLFPDTYRYDRGTTPEQIVTRMVKNFFERVDEERLAKAKAAGFSVYQWVTFASLVEKETGLATERPEIAGVFHNRLNSGMLLQTDPAVIYGIPNFNGNLTTADLARDTPYNTYVRPGLPHGPIASVGLASLDAVLNPAQTSSLYFVAKGDGSHYFSKTLEQHNRAVRYYQLKQGTEPPPE